MSNHAKGDWTELWDALYWAFVYDHRDIIAKNARISVMNMYLKNMKQETLKKHLKIAADFFRK